MMQRIFLRPLAVRMKNGYSAAALFGSFESLVKANLALELVDGVTKDKVERARERASASITESRNHRYRTSACGELL